MPEKLTPDICVIGAGATGLSVAAAAAACGASTVLIGRGAIGGEGLSSGGVPSMALLAAARRAADLRSGEFGVHASEIRVDFAEVQAHVRNVIAEIAPNASAERFAGLGVRVIKGHAKFLDRRTVAVGDTLEIRARRFVVATGAKPAVPPIPGLDEGPYLTNQTIFQLKELPSHLVIIGASAAGLEFAQAFRRLGSDVTVLETGGALAEEDPEAAAVVLAALDREDIEIRTGVKITGVAHALGQVAVTIEAGGKEQVGGSHLLLAAGRKPTIDGLALEAARIRHDAAGIAVNRQMRTSNRRVYAIGDVTAGQPRFTHAGSYHAELVVRNALFHLSARADASAIPRVIFTEPELAQTGLTEAQARSRGVKFRVLRWPYHDNDRALAERRPHGHIKALADDRGRILGATIVGANASELITTWSMAIAQKLTSRAFAELVVPYPTMAEIGKRAAIQDYTSGLTRPLLRRIMRLLRIFG